MRRWLGWVLLAACSSGPDGDPTGAGSSETTGTTAESATTTLEPSEGSESATTEDTGATEVGTGPADPIEQAIERGIEATASFGDENIVVLLLMNVMHRRFDIDAFAEAAAQYDATLGADPPIDAVAFRRVFDPTQVLSAEDMASIAPGVNQVTVPALFCDTLAPADGYGDVLQQNAALGGYEVTHVALALLWMEELACVAPLGASFRDQVALDTFALIDTGDGLDDLEIEAALFATLLDGPQALPEDLVDVIVGSQLPDGSWPRDVGGLEGDAHPTALALFSLLELQRPALDTFLAME